MRQLQHSQSKDIKVINISDDTEDEDDDEKGVPHGAVTAIRRFSNKSNHINIDLAKASS
jgi:hypothetical protein